MLWTVRICGGILNVIVHIHDLSLDFDISRLEIWQVMDYDKTQSEFRDHCSTTAAQGRIFAHFVCRATKEATHKGFCIYHLPMSGGLYPRRIPDDDETPQHC